MEEVPFLFTEQIVNQSSLFPRKEQKSCYTGSISFVLENHWIVNICCTYLNISDYFMTSYVSCSYMYIKIFFFFADPVFFVV